MNTTHTYSISLATLLLVTISGACDLEDPDTQLEIEASVEGESEPSANIEFDIGDSEALVASNPEIIDGLEPVGYDEERAVYVYDRDGDGWPDISEELAGTDMFDPDSSPDSDISSPPLESGGFPSTSCRPGFTKAGTRLCISSLTQNSATYMGATSSCRNRLSHVCTYEDLTYLYMNSSLDATYSPSGKALGGMTGDDQILCGNRSITYDNDPDWANFDGHCNKATARPYWCCHDFSG